MSLSNFNKLGKGKEEGVSHDSTRHSHGSDKECFEPFRENGQASIQGPTLNGRDPVLNDFPLVAPSYGTSVDQEDNIVHPTYLPCTKDLPNVTGLNKLRFSETFPLPRSRNLSITKCQSGTAKNSMPSKLHTFDVGQPSNYSDLLNLPFCSHFASVPMANNVKHTPAPLPPKLSEAICKKDGKNHTVVDQSLDKAIASGKKDPEPAIAMSSACSANGFDRLKRKSPEMGDSDSYSDEAEEESIDSKRANHERRQRARINEKMRSLQELLPICNKVDEESMLDNAIEYTKALQLQMQIVSMGARMFMSPMMLPGATMQAMYRPHVPQFLPTGTGMGMGMGMGFGVGMNGLNNSAAQMPNTPFPCYPFGQVGLVHPTQELPTSAPCAPLPPGVVVPPFLVPTATSREVAENIGSRAAPNDQSNRTSQNPD